MLDFFFGLSFSDTALSCFEAGLAASVFGVSAFGVSAFGASAFTGSAFGASVFGVSAFGADFANLLLIFA